jgi:hypothetical protein
MSRAYKGLEIAVYGKLSERSAGVENVVYVREKLKTMKMADLVRYLVGLGRRYEAGELFGAEVKQILAELQGNQPLTPVASVTASGRAAKLEAASLLSSPPAQATASVNVDSDVDNELINDLLDSIQGLE